MYDYFRSIIGSIPFFFVSILYTLKFYDYVDTLRTIFFPLPQFAVADALYSMDWIIVTESICKLECENRAACDMDRICELNKECCSKAKTSYKKMLTHA